MAGAHVITRRRLGFGVNFSHVGRVSAATFTANERLLAEAKSYSQSWRLPAPRPLHAQPQCKVPTVV
jgi:hypothetical protein